MSGELMDEVEAIKSIYGDEILNRVDEFYILSLPQNKVSLRILFPPDYPDSIPEILGTEGTGDHARKGYGKHVVDIAIETLQNIFNPGSVCLFDLLQELDLQLSPQTEVHNLPTALEIDGTDGHPRKTSAPSPLREAQEVPEWVLSTQITEKKSVFIARACSVETPSQAHAFVAHLLATDKRASRATHNITAYRIRAAASAGSSGERLYQDCDDDGETAAGGRLLHLLHLMGVWGLLVVVSRWYGGVKLGPDRFSIINNVAREAIVEGGWAKSRDTKA